MPQEVDGSGGIEDGSNLPSVSPTIAKLNAPPKRRYGNVTWPEGTPQPLTKDIADHFFSLMSPAIAR